jgi:transmembrane sensor
MTIADSKADAELLAQAAAWVAILHGPNRSAATERGFARWFKLSPEHAAAFEQATQVWEESSTLPRTTRFGRVHRGRRLLRPIALAAAAGVALVVIGVLLHARLAGVTTGIGEQRVVTLEDGSRMVLNAVTHAVVAYDARHRQVEIEDGEALFEVAKRPDWPFVVVAGGRRIEALGTTFAVRSEPTRLAVTLVEGKVTVAPLSSRDASARRADSVLLLPGQRVTFEAGRSAVIDRPPLQRALAWQRREVSLDDAPLAEAVAEMNRYGVVPLVIEAPGAAQLRVTGLFRAGDSLSFGKAIAVAYGLEVVEEPERIVLRAPRR